MGLSYYDIKNIIRGKHVAVTPADDFRIIDSYAIYKDSNKKVANQPLDYLCYELESINPETGEKLHFFKALKFARVIRLPKSAKQSTSFMDIQQQVLTSVYENGYNMVTIIANIIQPKPIGLLFLYGVQGIADNIEDAKQKADEDFIGLTRNLQGSFRTLELKNIDAEESEWLREKMYNMDYMTVVRGVPKANHGGEDMGNKGIGGKNLNPDSQGTLEEFIAGMADYEYVIQVLSTPVFQRTLKEWSLQTEKQMTAWYGQLQGTKALSFNLSMPMMYMANQSSSEGWSKAYTDAESVSFSEGESFSNSYSESVGQGLSQSFSESFGITEGQSVTNSVTHSVGVTEGQTIGQTQGITVGQTEGQTIGQTDGLTFGQTQGVTTGQTLGESLSQSFGQSVGQNVSSSTSVGTSQSVSNSESVNQSTSANVSNTLGTTQGQNYSQGFGSSVSQSHNVGSSESFGTSENTSVGESTSTSVGQSTSSSQSSSVSNGWSTSHGTSTSESHSSSESFTHSESVTETESHSEGTSTTGTFGTTTGGNAGVSLFGISAGGSHSVSASVSTGKTTSDTYGTSESVSNGYSKSESHSTSSSESFTSSQSGSVSMGSSVTQGSSLTQGNTSSLTNSTGSSHNVGASESYGTGSSQSTNESFGLSQSTSQSQSISNGVSQGWGSSVSQSNGMSTSQGFSQGQSFSSNMSNSASQSMSNSMSNSLSNSASQSQSTSASQSTSNSMSNSVSNSQSTSQSVSNSVSNGQSVGSSISQSQSQSTSHGTSENYSQSQGISQGTSKSNGVSQSQSLSTGMSGAHMTGSSSSMGFGPSIGFNKSYQWMDQQVKDILELLEYQNERIKKSLRGEGAFYTYVYIACPSRDALAAATALAKSTWQNEYAMVNPLQVLKLTEEEQKHLLYHFAAFSADVTREAVGGAMQYKYSTVLLPQEYVAYTHLPRISEGGVFADVNDIPKFAVPSQLKGEIYMGSILSAERYTFLNGYKTPFDFRIDESELMHGFFTGASRSGKTVAAMRFVAELANVRRKNTGKRLRIVCMDPKQDWRTLARFVDPDRFRFYSLGNCNFRPVKINPFKIPKGVVPQTWIDGVIDIYCRAYGLLERGKQMMGETIYSLYEDAGVFEAQEHENWQELVSDLSRQVTFQNVYKRMESIKARLEDPTNPKGRAGNDTRDAYARLLDRLQCFSRPFSIETKLFGTSEGIGIDEMIGNDDVTILESSGLEKTFKNFIFGVITSGFYKYAKAHEGGYLAADQYETVLVIEEANEVLIGNDCAGSGSGSAMGMSVSGQSEFEEILDQSAGYGLFIIAITQKIADMPKSIIANSGLVFAGRLKTPDDITVVIRSVAREERYDDRDMVKWFPRMATGMFVCQRSRTFDFKDAEPILVQIARLNAVPPSNAEIDEMLSYQAARQAIRAS